MFFPFFGAFDISCPSKQVQPMRLDSGRDLSVEPLRTRTPAASGPALTTWRCDRQHAILEETCHVPEVRCTFCASLRSRKAHGHVTRAILCENLQGKCRAPDGSKTRAAGFVRVCAVKMTGKRAGRQSEHLDQAPPFTPTVRTPQCGHAVWGKTVYNCTSYCSSYIFTVST